MEIEHVRILLPNFDEQDWPSLIHYVHFYECSGQDLSYRSSFNIKGYVYKYLEPIAYQAVSEGQTSGFLYELALTRSFEELDAVLPLAYQELNLPFPHPDGFLTYLDSINRQLNEHDGYDLAYLVYRIMFDFWNESNGVIAKPRFTKPYEDLLITAWNAWEPYPGKELEVHEEELEKFKRQLATICQERPTVTLEPFTPFE